jgi:3',5'-cyclic AMP phosphodiesterase CpdA
MKLLVFSDIHGDLAALERLLAIEADYYIAAGDLANFARGLDAAAALLESAASGSGSNPATMSTNPPPPRSAKSMASATCTGIPSPPKAGTSPDSATRIPPL